MELPARVLQVVGRLDRGGIEAMIISLYGSIDRSKIQFDFVEHTTDPCDYDAIVRQLGGRIYRCPRYTGRNHLSYINWWKSFFREHPEYNVVHGHVRSTASIYLSLARRNGCMTIAHSHSTSSGRGVSAVVKSIMQLPIRGIADYLLACSVPAGTWLFGRRACETNRFMVVRNAVDSGRFSFDAQQRMIYRDKMNLEGRYVIGHVGRLHPAKNHGFLLDVFKRMHDVYPRALLLMIGEGELRPQIRERIEQLGLGEAAILLGNREDIPQLLQAMDVFVFPSLWEGVPVALIEAQAAGLPCIVADTITKEVRITEEVTAVSLRSSQEVWVNEIMKYAGGFQREDMREAIAAAGYDVKTTAKHMCGLYLEMVRTVRARP